MVHVTVPLNSGSCAVALDSPGSDRVKASFSFFKQAKECWQEVQQAVEQGGDQAV